MARKRRLLRRYPHNAERLYYGLLRTAIEQWFAELKEKLFQHPAIRKDELFDNIFDQQQGRWADFSEAIKNRMGDVSGQVSDTVQRTFAEQAQQVQNDLGIDLSRGGVLPFGENQSAVNAFTRQNTLLIKDIGDKAARDIEIAVQDIVSRGASTKELQKLIQENLDSTKKRAALIARDQIGKLNGQLTRIQHEEAGIKNYEWSTSNDSRVRSEHAKREGKVFSYKKPPPDGNPGSPIRCRCVALPVFDDVGPEQVEELPVQPEAEKAEKPKKEPEKSNPNPKAKQKKEPPKEPEKASRKPKASSGGGSVPPKPPRPPVASGGSSGSSGNEGGSPPIPPRRRGAQPPIGGGGGNQPPRAPGPPDDFNFDRERAKLNAIRALADSSVFTRELPLASYSHDAVVSIANGLHKMNVTGFDDLVTKLISKSDDLVKVGARTGKRAAGDFRSALGDLKGIVLEIELAFASNTFADVKAVNIMTDGVSGEIDVIAVFQGRLILIEAKSGTQNIKQETILGKNLGEPNQIDGIIQKYQRIIAERGPDLLTAEEQAMPIGLILVSLERLRFEGMPAKRSAFIDKTKRIWGGEFRLYNSIDDFLEGK
jgi:SPP1 gp7 family putative phage head morphogenesis protein